MGLAWSHFFFVPRGRTGRIWLSKSPLKRPEPTVKSHLEGDATRAFLKPLSGAALQKLWSRHCQFARSL